MRVALFIVSVSLFVACTYTKDESITIKNKGAYPVSFLIRLIHEDIEEGQKIKLRIPGGIKYNKIGFHLRNPYGGSNATIIQTSFPGPVKKCYRVNTITASCVESERCLS